MARALRETQKAYVYVGLAYLTFVVYGSLVPLDFRDLGWDEAWRAFRDIPFLNLGIASRADWIANALLYIPLTFVWSGAIVRFNHPGKRIVGFAIVLLASISLSIAIEFIQLFFPPRTVSLNDILAETLGSIGGVVLWLAIGVRFRGWLADLRKGGSAALTAALSLYLIAYVALGLFPFDFVVSFDELAYKLATRRDDYLFATQAYAGTGHYLLQLFAEVIAALPLGVLVARLSRSGETPPIGAALLAGAMLGLTIEGIQLVMYSGIAQGVSVLTRIAGTGLGLIAYERLPVDRARQIFCFLSRLRLLALLIVPAYLVSLAVLLNWKINDWIHWDTGFARLQKIRFLPFYYHYFTTETAALLSLSFTAAAYAPVGAIWFWLTGVARKDGAITSATLAAMLAGLFEFGKLFQRHLRPDPTNILIAATSAAAAYVLIRWSAGLLSFPSSVPAVADGGVPSKHAETVQVDPARHGRIGLLALLCSGILIWAVVRYPLGGYWLAAGLIVYLAVLLRWPQGWLVIVPAALPVLDLTHWTGRFFFDEFDCLLLATVALAGWLQRKKTSYSFPPIALLVISLFTASTVIAVIVGAYPYPTLDLNSFSNYYSPYNALRVGKSLLWALLLISLIKSELERDAVKTHRLFALGMTIGVFAAGVVVLWERIAFTGLFNFDSDYRVVGMFSGMHIGGAYIEGYLVTAMPFVIWWTLVSRQWIGRLFGVGVFLLGIYAVMVTYSRGGYIALALSMTLLVAISVLAKKAASFKPWRAAGAAVLLLILIGVAWPIAHGTFMRERFSIIERDLHMRTTHWEDALRMMDDTLVTKLFGMGLGRYPETYFWRNYANVRVATYNLKKEFDNTYLTLGSGDPLYVEQLVNIRPGRRYRLSFSARSQTDKAELALPVCEKWMLYSMTCAWPAVRIGNTGGQWRRFTFEFNTNDFLSSPIYARRPVKVALVNPINDSVVDVDQVSIIAQDGREVLRNGDFTKGMDHWTFTVNNYWPWHLENTWLQLYFEQGAIGFILFVLLLALAVTALVKRNHERELPIPALAAALAGFLVVGTANSLLEFPRLAMLFYILIAMVILRSRRRKTRHVKYYGVMDADSRPDLASAPKIRNSLPWRLWLGRSYEAVKYGRDMRK